MTTPRGVLCRQSLLALEAVLPLAKLSSSYMGVRAVSGTKGIALRMKYLDVREVVGCRLLRQSPHSHDHTIDMGRRLLNRWSGV